MICCCHSWGDGRVTVAPCFKKRWKRMWNLINPDLVKYLGLETTCCSSKKSLIWAFGINCLFLKCAWRARSCTSLVCSAKWLILNSVSLIHVYFDFKSTAVQVCSPGLKQRRMFNEEAKYCFFKCGNNVCAYRAQFQESCERGVRLK